MIFSQLYSTDLTDLNIFGVILKRTFQRAQGAKFVTIGAGGIEISFIISLKRPFFGHFRRTFAMVASWNQPITPRRNALGTNAICLMKEYEMSMFREYHTGRNCFSLVSYVHVKKLKVLSLCCFFRGVVLGKAMPYQHQSKLFDKYDVFRMAQHGKWIPSHQNKNLLIHLF